MLMLNAACAQTSQRWQEVEGTELKLEAGEEVVLDASSIFAGGIYHWVQLRGPSVPISDPNASVLRFIAPDVAESTSIILSLLNVRGDVSATTVFTIIVVPRGSSDAAMDAGGDSGTGATTDAQSDSSPDAVRPGQHIAAHSKAAPVIDGELSEFSGSPAITLTVSATRATSSVQLLWDNDTLYIAADVMDGDVQTTLGKRDEEVWNDDSVEFMFDPGNEGGADFNLGDFKIIVNAAGVVRDTEGTAAGEFDTSWTPSHQVSAVPTASGYRIEMAVPWTEFGLAGPPNSAWGFDLALNDTITSGATNKAAWWNDNGGTINDPSGWGELVFVQ